MDDFNFGLLRVSIIQILRANGFDKCKPSTLNVVTDLYIRYLNLLVEKARKYSSLRNTRDPDTSDILAAMIDIGLIKTAPSYNTKSVKALENWLLSSSFQTSKKLNALPNNVIKTIIEKRKLEENQNEDDKLKKLKQRQDFYNHFKQDIDAKEDNEDFDSNELSLNWLNYLIEKDVKLGNNAKFLNSSLKETDTKGEYLIDEGVEVNKLLPINLRQDEVENDEAEPEQT